MEERYSALVVHLQKCRERGRKRVEQMAALLCAESVNGPVFGHEGNMIASMLEDALDAADRELLGKQENVSAGDATNQQAAAGVLKHIEDAYQKAFNARFECNYGYHVPMLRRLLYKSETVEGLKRFAEAWIAAGQDQLVPGNAYVNSRLWGDATVKSFASNLNRIKSHAKLPTAPARQWAMKEKATSWVASVNSTRDGFWRPVVKLNKILAETTKSSLRSPDGCVRRVALIYSTVSDPALSGAHD